MLMLSKVLKNGSTVWTEATELKVEKVDGLLWYSSR